MGLFDFLKQIQNAGVAMLARGALNFTTGFTLTDDPTNNRINVAASGGGASAIASFSSGTASLVASQAGTFNRLSGTCSAATLPAATGSKNICAVKFINLASFSIGRSGSDTIDGATTYAMAAGNYSSASFFDAAAGVWDAYPGIT